ncbi:serine hydrolase domain-containing protein [Mycolicibacterium sp. J2]|uniref:serine hydrolase domain-containing protein n=1 Tax=Mycolicibacterium sp. J2 TaxID=2993511 RepID=UPI00224B80F7|nr:serine hydrolase [Mycolicibacterium sp. J2]MCX2712509.1 serine hydrolase [Mycolicibacterium sp. J2]
MSTPQLGLPTGDPELIARVEPLARAAHLGDRLSVVCIRDGVHRHAHFGAGPATVYEIGSVTKTMTSLLFAEAIETGELRTDTPLGTLLDLEGCPAAEVTLAELAGHRSGLPRIATGLRDRANAVVAVLRHRNPYTADLQRLLAQARSAEIGARGQFSYSNLGFALLGQALAAHAGAGFPELLHHRLFGRLGMTESSTPLSGADLPTGAPTGWSARGTPEQAWTMGAYAPAGGVRSTAGDMASYAQALLDGAAPGLTALDPRWDTDGGSQVGYAWFTDRVADVDIVWHNGATGGFSSMLALDRAGAAAAVILANTAVAVDEIALRLLVDTT